MKTKSKFFRSLALMLTMGCASTGTLARTYCPVELMINPYAGIDLQYRYLGFQKGYGDNIFHSKFPQANIYAGLRVNEYLGFELGYEHSFRRSRTNTVPRGETSLGQVFNADIGYKSNIELYGPHVDVVGSWCIGEEYPFELFGSLGAAFLTIKGDRIPVTLNGVPVINNVIRTFGTQKVVARIAGGIQYSFTPEFGLRGSIAYENTGRIKFFSKEGAVPLPEVRMKDSLILSIGAFYTY